MLIWLAACIALFCFSRRPFISAMSATAAIALAILCTFSTVEALIEVLR